MEHHALSNVMLSNPSFIFTSPQSNNFRLRFFASFSATRRFLHAACQSKQQFNDEFLLGVLSAVNPIMARLTEIDQIRDFGPKALAFKAHDVVNIEWYVTMLVSFQPAVLASELVPNSYFA